MHEVILRAAQVAQKIAAQQSLAEKMSWRGQRRKELKSEVKQLRTEYRMLLEIIRAGEQL